MMLPQQYPGAYGLAAARPGFGMPMAGGPMMPGTPQQMPPQMPPMQRPAMPPQMPPQMPPGMQIPGATPQPPMPIASFGPTPQSPTPMPGGVPGLGGARWGMRPGMMRAAAGPWAGGGYGSGAQG